MRRLPTTTPATRTEVLRAAEQLSRAARLLTAHAQRCTDPTAPAHAEALRQARGMVRAVVDAGRTGEVE